MRQQPHESVARREESTSAWTAGPGEQTEGWVPKVNCVSD